LFGCSVSSSEPPDIKNWFSSYVYDSPEVPELVADHDGGNGSETQDPFEVNLFLLNSINQVVNTLHFLLQISSSYLLGY
jgi:hypothetical protein